MSTDKLEKPKHHHSQPGSTQTKSNPLSAPSTGSLPRRNANGVFYRTPQDFVGGSQQSNLRRNCSMNDLQQRNQDDQSSWLPAPPPQVQEVEIMFLRQKMVLQVEEGFQVPPSMVRTIVITVLQSQVFLCRQDTCVLS